MKAKWYQIYRSVRSFGAEILYGFEPLINYDAALISAANVAMKWVERNLK